MDPIIKAVKFYAFLYSSGKFDSISYDEISKWFLSKATCNAFDKVTLWRFNILMPAWANNPKHLPLLK